MFVAELQGLEQFDPALFVNRRFERSHGGGLAFWKSGLGARVHNQTPSQVRSTFTASGETLTERSSSVQN